MIKKIILTLIAIIYFFSNYYDWGFIKYIIGIVFLVILWLPLETKK
ncbi:hypothetical protein ERIN107935_07245 [Erysipelothrix inopinata]